MVEHSQNEGVVRLVRATVSRGNDAHLRPRVIGPKRQNLVSCVDSEGGAIDYNGHFRNFSVAVDDVASNVIIPNTCWDELRGVKIGNISWEVVERSAGIENDWTEIK